LSSLFGFSNKLKKIRAFALPVCFILFFTPPCQASAPFAVVINEIAWMGTKLQEIEQKNWWRYEWFELYNNTDSPIVLDGWNLELYRSDLDWKLELKGTIQPKKYFLVVSSDKISSVFDQNYSNLAGKFVNEGQKVLLRDSSGLIADELDCSGGWFAGNNEEKLTMERIDSLSPGNNKDNWAQSKNQNGTPGSKNNPMEISELEEKTEKATSAVTSSVNTSFAQKNEPAPKNSSLKENNHLAAILAAVFLAIFSGIAILLLKKLQQNKKLL
jgi:hypothetical protein